MKTVLRYVATHDLEPVSATAVGFTMRANGVFKPEVSHTGHQPRGYDQYTELYNVSTVTASKISVTFSYEGYWGSSAFDSTGKPSLAVYDKGENSVTAPPGVICLVHKSPEMNATGTIENFQEKDKTKWVQIVPTSGPRVVATGLKCRDFFGKDFLVGAEGYTGSDSADPTEQLFYHIMAGLNTDEYPAQINLRANVCIEYQVTWTSPKQLAAS